REPGPRRGPGGACRRCHLGPGRLGRVGDRDRRGRHRAPRRGGAGRVRGGLRLAPLPHAGAGRAVATTPLGLRLQRRRILRARRGGPVPRERPGHAGDAGEPSGRVAHRAATAAELDRRQARIRLGRAATAEHVRAGAELWLGIRPLTRGRKGTWVKGDLSWRTFEYRLAGRDYDATHGEALTRIFAAASVERSYSSGAIEHLWLNSITSPLLW